MFRRNPYAPNPPGAGTALLGATMLVGGIMAFAGGRQIARRQEATPTPGPEPLPPPPGDCAPYVYDQSAVRQQIEDYLDVGSRDPTLIAANTATKLFADHPDGSRHTFPPAPSAPEEVFCVWNRVVAETDQAFRDRGLDPDEEEDKPQGVVWRTVNVGSGSPDLAGYPWNDAVFEEENYPTPGTFYRVEFGDYGAKLWRELVGSALAMAGVDPSPAFSDSKLGKRLRKEMRQLVLCSPFNDGRVTSTNANFAGGNDPNMSGGEANKPLINYMMGPNGRGLVWLPRHKDDAARLAQGLPAMRNVSLDGKKLGSGASQMLLWLPAVNLDKLRGTYPVVTTAGMEWPGTGKNTIHPPTPVDALGVDTNGVTLPGGVGCQPTEGPWG